MAVNRNLLEAKLWTMLTHNKFLISKYIEEKDEQAISNLLIRDKRLAQELKSNGYYDVIFDDVKETIRVLDSLNSIGYVEKSDGKLSILKYQCDLYFYYPLVSPFSTLELPGTLQKMSEEVLLTPGEYQKIKSALSILKTNVNSGKYTNLLYFDYHISSEFNSTIYEIREKYLDSILFDTSGESVRIYLSEPLNIPEQELDVKKHMFFDDNEIDFDVFHCDIKRVNQLIQQKLEWKRRKIAFLTNNYRGYWLMRNRKVIDYQDLVKRNLLGIPNFPDTFFISIENYFSRTFEDSVAQYLQTKNNYFTKVRIKPTYLKGKEIDVLGSNMLNEVIFCECKLRLRLNPITEEEINSFILKVKLIRNQDEYRSKKLIFRLVTNIDKIESAAMTAASENGIQIGIASLSRNWQRRSDWKINDIRVLN